VDVVFTPTAAGTRLALLTFQTDAGALVVPLAGSGAEAVARSSGCASGNGSPAGLFGFALAALALLRSRRAGRRPS
jgi:MYXO-CTERM domain-containing protein